MAQSDPLNHFRHLEIPGKVQIGFGREQLPQVQFTTPWSRGELYLHGAQVTSFERQGETPLLFLSQASRYAPGTAIRGGIPICFPWFGSRPGAPAHGYARITEWQLLEAKVNDQGGVVLHLELPDPPGAPEHPIKFELIVSVSEHLALELVATNRTTDLPTAFEECLHTYFRVGDITQIAISGLEGAEYLDHTQKDRALAAPAEAMQINSQTDRTFLGSSGPVSIHDPVLGRTIRISKTGSSSTVVWNPWTTQVLADLAPEEYRCFVCVESGNIGSNQIELAPGDSTRLRVQFESGPDESGR